MEWKTFDEIPTGKDGEIIVVLRHKTQKDLVFVSQINHPFISSPEKYQENFYVILVADQWYTLTDNIKDFFEWLDPYFDKKLETDRNK